MTWTLLYIPVITATDVDSPGYLASYNDSEDPDAVSSDVTGLPRFDREDPLKANPSPVSSSLYYSGVFILDNITYTIQPLKPVVSTNETRWPHVVYRLPDIDQVQRSANRRGMWQSFRDLHLGEFMRRRKIMTAMKLQRVNGSLSSALIYLGQLANIIDGVLQDTNIRVTLKYVELWNYGNLVAVNRNTRMMLHNIFTYRQDALSFVKVDVVHLISGQSFDNDEMGMAVPDSICTQRAVSVSY
ncbi:hypothetical protein LSH36_606g04117, partial [Paralvinella palmiformis]